MLGTILLSKTYQNILLSNKFKNLLQTAVQLGCVPDVMRNTTFYSSCWITNNNKRNNTKFFSQIKEDKLFRMNALNWDGVKDIKVYENLTICTIKDDKFFHTNSVNWSEVKISAFDLKKASDEFFKINMIDLKKAPLPAFWVGFAGLGPFMFPTFTSMLIGYSHFLSSLELAYGIAVLACLGGAKFGYLVAHKEFGSWENYTLSGIPLILATLAIASPPTLSFLMVILGLLAAFIIDLNTGRYPPWYKALRGVLTNVSVFFLFIGMLQRMLH